MGFLDNLLKKEARKIISNVVDDVTDNVSDSIRSIIRPGEDDDSHRTSRSVAPTKAPVNPRYKEGLDGDDADCKGNMSLLRSRIEKLAAEDFAEYELRADISTTAQFSGDADINDADISRYPKLSYGFFQNGELKAVLLLLTSSSDYRRKEVSLIRTACRNHGIFYMNLMPHLPNRRTYIVNKLKKGLMN